MHINKLLAMLLFIGLVSGQSVICDRMASTDIYCNDDGTRTAVIYSYQTNVLINSTYQPFEDVANLTYNGDHFELAYGNRTSTISLLVVSGGNDTAINKTGLKVIPVIKKLRGGFEYGVTLDNASAMDALKFKIGGDQISGIKYDFSDTVTNGTSLTSLDSKTFIVNNDKAAKQLTIDPSITLNESNGGNIGDSFTYGSGTTTNYGTYGSVAVATSIASAIYGWVMFNLSSAIPYGATITNANLSMYMFIAPLLTKTYQAYNTTAAWTETGITWNNQPGADTLQDSMATGTTAGVWLSWNVTPAALASFNSPYPMQNLSIRISDSAGVGTSYAANFTSRDNATTASRPQLYITYTLPACTETGLVGYWKFDENTGSYTYDSSGCGGNTGTLVNSPTWTTGKNYQTPYALGYVNNNYVNVGNASSLSITKNITISAWVYPTTISSSYPTIVEKPYSSAVLPYQIYALYLENAGGTDHIAFAITSGGTRVLQEYDTGLNLKNKWSHIVAVYDGVHMLLYLNGNLINSVARTGDIDTITQPVTIGGSPVYSSGGFNGTIDEVKIWNYSLSASQVMAEATNYCPLNSIGIEAFNESSSSQIIAFSFIASNTTSTFLYATTTGTPIFTDYYCNSSFPVNSVTFAISNSSFYSPRYYYGTLTAGGYYYLYPYLLPLNDQYPITTTFTILAGNTVIPNALIAVERQLGGSWTLIGQKYTDSSGSAAFNLDYQSTYYIITTASRYSSRYDYITPTSNIYYLSLLSTGVSTPFWQYYGLYQAACTVTNATYPALLITCSLNDTSGHLIATYLTAQEIGTYGSVNLCSNTTTPNNTVSCYIANPGNETIYYTLAAKTASDPGYIAVGGGTTNEHPAPNFQNAGIIPALFFTLTLGFVGLILSPAAGVVGLISGILLSSVMLLINIPITGLLAVIFLGGIVAYMLR